MPKYDWAKMTPRERDALVAEKVMEWVEEEVSPTGFTRWFEYRDGTRYDVSKRATLFLPSTQFDDAWRVFERFTQAWIGYQGTDYACEITDGVGDEARVGRASYDDDHVNKCECVCLAALRAKGVDV